MIGGIYITLYMYMLRQYTSFSDRSHVKSQSLYTMHTRYDYVTLIPLVLQLGLRIGPIQRMGAN